MLCKIKSFDAISIEYLDREAGGEQDIAPLTCGVHKRCARHVGKRVDKHTIVRRIHQLTLCPIDRQYSQCNFKNMQFRNRTSYRKNFSGVSRQEGKNGT